jgi:hypothetical protein
MRFMTNLQKINVSDEMRFPENSARLPQGVLRPLVGKVLFGEAGRFVAPKFTRLASFCNRQASPVERDVIPHAGWSACEADCETLSSDS